MVVEKGYSENGSTEKEVGDALVKKRNAEWMSESIVAHSRWRWCSDTVVIRESRQFFPVLDDGSFGLPERSSSPLVAVGSIPTVSSSHVHCCHQPDDKIAHTTYRNPLRSIAANDPVHLLHPYWTCFNQNITLYGNRTIPRRPSLSTGTQNNMDDGTWMAQMRHNVLLHKCTFTQFTVKWRRKK